METTVLILGATVLAVLIILVLALVVYTADTKRELDKAKADLEKLTKLAVKDFTAYDQNFATANRKFAELEHQIAEVEQLFTQLNEDIDEENTEILQNILDVAGLAGIYYNAETAEWEKIPAKKSRNTKKK